MENKNRWDFFSTIIFCGRKIRVLCCIYKYDIVTFGGVVFQQIVVIKRTILGVYTSVLSVIWASLWTTSSNVKRLSFEPLVPLASHPQSEKQFFHLKIRCTQRSAGIKQVIPQMSFSSPSMFEVLIFPNRKLIRMTEVLDMQSEHHHVTSLRKSQPKNPSNPFKFRRLIFWAKFPLSPPSRNLMGFICSPKKYTTKFPKKPVNTYWIRKKLGRSACWVAQHDEIHPSGRRLAASPPRDPMVKCLVVG